ncbi:hypothetical protein GOBAR_DD21349 [Gossypium barbadense]|nr:hypothetical protein GOBAR_DD21349 [Gossypium barbadense]
MAVGRCQRVEVTEAGGGSGGKWGTRVQRLGHLIGMAVGRCQRVEVTEAGGGSGGKWGTRVQRLGLGG